ncbi:hypothetical protein H8E50_04270 [bacterium]|nr:hypothetical protein [bacterium]
MKRKIAVVISLLIALSLPVPDLEAGIRGRARIQTPSKRLIEAMRRPAVSREIQAELPPLDEQEARTAIISISEAWNSGGLGEYLDESFYNKDRLLDTISSDIPQDAVLRVLNVRNIKMLNNSVAQGEEQGTIIRTSQVSAVVETQVEFNDPKTGFQRLPGTLEMVLKIDEIFSMKGGAGGLK